MPRPKNVNRDAVTSREGPALTIRLSPSEKVSLDALIQLQREAADAAGIVSNPSAAGLIKLLLKREAIAKGVWVDKQLSLPAVPSLTKPGSEARLQPAPMQPGLPFEHAAPSPAPMPPEESPTMPAHGQGAVNQVRRTVPPYTMGKDLDIPFPADVSSPSVPEVPSLPHPELSPPPSPIEPPVDEPAAPRSSPIVPNAKRLQKRLTKAIDTGLVGIKTLADEIGVTRSYVQQFKTSGKISQTKLRALDAALRRRDG